MSVDALVGAIRAEAAAEAERLLADARATAAARTAAAEAAAARQVAEALAEAEPAILGAETRALNEARLNLAARRTARLAARVEAAFALAERRLEAMAAGGAAPSEPPAAAPGRWDAAIARLAEEAAAVTGPGELRVRPRDLGALDAVAGRLAAASVRTGTDPEMPPGVRARSADGRLVVDATIPVRLARARSALQPGVAALLRPDPSRGPAGEGAAGSPGPTPAVAGSRR